MSEFLHALHSASTAPGAALAVIRQGDLIHSECVGMSDLQAEQPITPVTNFRLASVTKQFTAAAILLLVQRGKISLDSSVNRFLGLPPWGGDVTIYHLLTHISGLPDYEPLIQSERNSQLNDQDVLELLRTQSSLLFKPGDQFRYSNSGYVLLGLLVEAISGESFPQFLHSNIFQPLGMKATIAHVEGLTTVSHRAFGYSHLREGFAQTDQSLTSALLGDGGVYSNLRNLQRWDAAIKNCDLLDPATWKQVFTRARLNNGTETNYGYGWQLNQYRGLQCISHSGSTIGFRNFIARFPEPNLTLIYLSNRSEPPPATLLDTMLDTLIPGLPAGDPGLSSLIAGQTTLDPFS